MRRRALAGVGLALILGAGACSPAGPPPPPPVSTPPATEPATDLLTAEAEALLGQIRASAQAGSVRDLARLADTFPEFVSNFGGATPFDHWYMQRRMGSEPNEALLRILEEPYAARRVGEEIWYIWPDLAALPPEALQPERLSFKDRARLRALIGQAGIDAIAAGEGYPGHRMAISSAGRWVYFVDGN